MLEALTAQAWVGSLIFARLGAVLMLAPGWGEGAVPASFRLSAALLVAMALAASIAPNVPAQPESTLAAAGLVIQEVLFGLILGACVRAFMSALAVAGSAAGMALSLSMAMQVDPTQQENGATLGVLIGLIGLVMVFASGLHLLMLDATVASYQRFPPGSFPLIGDGPAMHISAVSQAFTLGIQIAAPAIVFGLVFNMGLGLVARLIPQVQIFFITVPAVILLGLAVLALGLGAGMQAWITAMTQFVTDLR
jgi:flagellar biosynthetic protein FliR